jgi:hypothetical protein
MERRPGKGMAPNGAFRPVIESPLSGRQVDLAVPAPFVNLTYFKTNVIL